MNRQIKVQSWYGWMGYAVSILIGNDLEVILGTRFQSLLWLNEGGWASLTFGFISVQWNSENNYLLPLNYML